MKSAQLAGWGVLLVIAGTVYSLTELHRLSAEHADNIESKHHFAIDFGRLSRRHSTAERQLIANEGRAPVQLANAPGSNLRVPAISSIFSSSSVSRSADAGDSSLFAPSVEKEGKCFVYRNVDSWGVAVNRGDTYKVPNAAQCCDACLAAQHSDDPEVPGCNVWVWCHDKEKCGSQYHECWLKYLPYIHIAVPKEASLNSSVAWTSGTSPDLDLTQLMHGWKLKDDLKAKKDAAAARGKRYSAAAQPPVDPVSLTDTSLKALKEGVPQPQMYHTITSVQGLYNQWQTRIHYYHWKKMQAHCIRQGFCEMGGYTRLLHSGHPDNIMDEIPTVVVDPMPDSLLKHDDYIVLNRPYAFVTWVKTAQIPERYVLMAEPDHLFLRPLPNFMTGDKPAAFNFGYMNPAGDENCPFVKRHTGIRHSPQCEEVAPIGSSPTFLALHDMRKVMPLWLNLSIAVYKDKEATKVWGWVQEMYAFAMAVWTAGIREVDLYKHLMAQPPYDSEYELTPGRPFYILHYTYGLDFNTTTGKALFSTVGDWHFDKREHQNPFQKDMKEPPDNIDFDLGRAMIRAFNEATAAIPCWDLYHSSGGKTVTKDCAGTPRG